MTELPFNFDVVSCQFAMHYAFDSEQRARTFLRNVATRLRPGGVFIGTIPSAGWLVYESIILHPSASGTDSLAVINSPNLIL